MIYQELIEKTKESIQHLEQLKQCQNDYLAIERLNNGLECLYFILKELGV